MDTKIEMSHLDRMLCFQVGCARNSAALMKGMQLEDGREDWGFDNHILGAFGEYAVARFLGINWAPIVGEVDTYRGDVGDKIQVKASRKRRIGRLYVRPQDDGRFIYIRCFVTMRFVELMGWALGHDVRKDEFWTTEGVHKACWAYPHDKLVPMDELKAECYT